MTVAEMQEAILKVGWQFEEHVFNDGKVENCYIRFSFSKNPHVFGLYSSDDEQVREDRENILCWGRLPRQDAWGRAYQLLMYKRTGDDTSK